MTNIPIIAFTGFKGSGKDTAAEFASKHFTKPVFINFADPVRSLLVDIFGIHKYYLTNPTKKEEVLSTYPYQSPRFIMQRLGTECFRKYWPDIWLKYWERRYNIYNNMDEFDLDKPDVIFITDVRFPNEYMMIEQYGGLIIKIDRLSKYPWQMNYPKFMQFFLPRIHKSERYINKNLHTEEIDNNDTKKDLKHRIDTFIKQLTD